MRAVAFARYGTADVLEVVDLPVPDPGPHEVRVRVVAAAVNPADWRIRSGQFRRFLRITLPFVPGSDLAGVVDAAGEGVAHVRVGDAVLGLQAARAGGGYAEFAVVPANQVAPIPPGTTYGDAASVPLCGLTALQALRDQARLRPGQRLLVHGAGGGVGTLAVQIGCALGADVTAVTSTDKLALVRGLGAAEVLDRTVSDLAPLAGRFDVVFDTVDALTNRQAMACLRPGGTAVTVNPFRGRLSPDRLAWTRGGRRMRSVLVRERGDDLRTLAGWLADGSVRAVVERTYPLGRAAEAHRRSETGRAGGKLVLAVDESLVDRAAGLPDAA